MEEQRQDGAHPTGADVGTAALCGAQARALADALEDVEYYKRRAEATQCEKEQLRGQVETLKAQLAELTDDHEKLERIHERISEDMEKQLNIVGAGYARMQGDALSALKEQHDGEMSAVRACHDATLDAMRAEMKQLSETVKEQGNTLQAQLAEMRKQQGLLVEKLDVRVLASWQRELINSGERLYKFWEEIGGTNGWRKVYPNADDLTKLLEGSQITKVKLQVGYHLPREGWLKVSEEELAGFVSVILSRLPQVEEIAIDTPSVWPFDMALWKASTNPFPSLHKVILIRCPLTKKQIIELFAMMDANQSKVPKEVLIRYGCKLDRCDVEALLAQYSGRLDIYW